MKGTGVDMWICPNNLVHKRFSVMASVRQEWWVNRENKLELVNNPYCYDIPNEIEDGAVCCECQTDAVWIESEIEPSEIVYLYSSISGDMLLPMTADMIKETLITFLEYDEDGDRAMYLALSEEEKKIVQERLYDEILINGNGHLPENWLIDFEREVPLEDYIKEVLQ